MISLSGIYLKLAHFLVKIGLIFCAAELMFGLVELGFGWIWFGLVGEVGGV